MTFLSLLFELMENEYTHIYNVKKLNSLRSLVEVISPVLVELILFGENIMKKLNSLKVLFSLKVL